MSSVFLSPPTNGDCTVLLAWHIDQGRFGEVNLDGLNAVLAAHSPGHMLEVKWKVALYVDERANKGQQDALTQIFSGQAGAGIWQVLRRSFALHGLGNAPYGCRDGHGHHARHAALDRLGSCPRVSDVGSHDGCDDGPRCQPGDSAFC